MFIWVRPRLENPVFLVLTMTYINQLAQLHVQMLTRCLESRTQKQKTIRTFQSAKEKGLRTISFTMHLYLDSSIVKQVLSLGGLCEVAIFL